MGPQRCEREGRWRKEEGLPWEQVGRDPHNSLQTKRQKERKKERKKPENRENKTKKKRALAVPGLDPGTFFPAARGPLSRKFAIPITVLTSVAAREKSLARARVPARPRVRDPSVARASRVARPRPERGACAPEARNRSGTTGAHARTRGRAVRWPKAVECREHCYK